ncbi:hypothetical protein BVX99_01655 [bacterium F16]|nr:hypothetical protein BVX99_01655 [bacterium F16]
MTNTLISIAIVVAIVAVFATRFVLKHMRRKRARRAPFPDNWLKIITRNLPVYKKLPRELQAQLQEAVKIFLAEKTFEGYEGVVIDDEIRLTVASQACLLILNRKNNYYPHLDTICIYPSAFLEKDPGPDGRRHARIGESWTRGSVVLAWDHSKGDARNFHDGHNVVIHEFSHQLDQLDGSSDGAPILEDRSCYQSWANVLSKDYMKLRKKVKNRQRDILDEYGATNPAEFFAVASEVFFERPDAMKKKHPELFEELKRYYKVAPEEWL